MTDAAGAGIALGPGATTVVIVDDDGRVLARRRVTGRPGADPSMLAGRLAPLVDMLATAGCAAVITWQHGDDAPPTIDVDTVAPIELATTIRRWLGEPGAMILTAVDRQGGRVAVAADRHQRARLRATVARSGVVVAGVEPLALTRRRAEGEPAHVAALVACGRLAPAVQLDLAAWPAPGCAGPAASAVWVVQPDDGAGDDADHSGARSRRWTGPWAWARTLVRAGRRRRSGRVHGLRSRSREVSQ
ncbi:MAG: hypothetical protein ACK5OX_15765 [Desertimonas sp.]